MLLTVEQQESSAAVNKIGTIGTKAKVLIVIMGILIVCLLGFEAVRYFGAAEVDATVTKAEYNLKTYSRSRSSRTNSNQSRFTVVYEYEGNQYTSTFMSDMDRNLKEGDRIKIHIDRSTPTTIYPLSSMLNSLVLSAGFIMLVTLAVLAMKRIGKRKKGAYNVNVRS